MSNPILSSREQAFNAIYDYVAANRQDGDPETDLFAEKVYDSLAEPRPSYPGDDTVEVDIDQYESAMDSIREDAYAAAEEAKVR